jgi:hypothetical protein
MLASLLLAAILSFAPEARAQMAGPSLPGASPERWEKAYRRSMTTSTIGAALPLAGVGLGYALSRTDDCEGACVPTYIAGGVPVVIGVPLLAGGSWRACEALQALELPARCGAARAAFGALAFTVISLPLLPAEIALAGVPAAYALGLWQVANDRWGWRQRRTLLTVFPVVDEDRRQLVATVVF